MSAYQLLKAGFWLGIGLALSTAVLSLMLAALAFTALYLGFSGVYIPL